MSLVRSLGPDFDNQFSGSYFVRDGALYRLESAGARTAVAIKFNPVQSLDRSPYGRALTPERINFPSSEIKDASFFDWPSLGYRSLENESYIRIARRRSVRRVIRPDTVSLAQQASYLADVMSARGVSYARMLSHESLMYHVFFPKYTKYTEGIKSIFAGDALCFAINHNWLVSIQGQGIGIQFKGRPVGSVDAKGNASITIPALDKLFKLVTTA